MSEYRLYVIGSERRIIGFFPLYCPDDAAAIETAKQHGDGRDLELWQRDRRVAKLTRKQDQAAGCGRPLL